MRRLRTSSPGLGTADALLKLSKCSRNWSIATFCEPDGSRLTPTYAVVPAGMAPAASGPDWNALSGPSL